MCSIFLVSVISKILNNILKINIFFYFDDLNICYNNISKNTFSSSFKKGTKYSSICYFEYKNKQYFMQNMAL